MLSIIVPVYNGSKYIEATMQSILNSSCQDIDIIAVDDGSTDGSAEILHKLSQEDRRVRVFAQSNQGVVVARNNGVTASLGDYIGFCDQDDLVIDNIYGRMIERMELDNSEVCLCSSARLIRGETSDYDILQDGCYTGRSILTEVLYPILFNAYDVPIANAGGNHYPNIWTCIIRKDFWDKHQLQFRAYMNHEDDMLLKTEILCLAKCVSTVADVGYLWRVNLGSETYAKHYIEEIGRKQDLIIEDMVRSLRKTEATEAEIVYFKGVMHCKQYVDAMYYLTSKEKKKTAGSIREYCQENIYSRDFEESIQMLKYLRKGRVKPRVLLPMMRRRKAVVLYIAELVLNSILNLSLQTSWLTNLERLIKKK